MAKAEKGKETAKPRAKGEIAPIRPVKVPSVLDEMDRFMERFFGRMEPMWWPRARWPEEMAAAFPSVDIFEDDANVIVKAEVPGVGKEDLEVSVEENMITISGEKKKEEKVEEKDYYRVERSHGSFRRSFSLPSEVESAKAKARFKNGVLEVTIPKSEKAGKRKIKVTVE
ncbi:MAG: Hsp20/alpha crystallin family protein [Thermodesulfovibrionales bacterium]